MKLTKLGKNIFTIITILISILIYHLMAILGVYAESGIFYQVVLVCGWAWLIMGQFGVYSLIWN